MTDEIIDLIGNVGFPIAIAIALFYQLIKTNDMVREFQSTIDENTMTIKRLARVLEDQENKAG